MAVKIVRQPNKIVLLGAPTSAAAMSAGHEGAPAALRAAGLVDRLHSIGYEVSDLGDDPPQLYKPDEESPRARNIRGVLAAVEALKPRVEQAVKSAALPLILSGDCSMALATVAGARRYFRNVSMIYMDRDADLNTPATTPSGSLDGMVVSHLTGRGAAEMVRFWGEPPLVREPDLALFGVARLDPAEEQLLKTSPLKRYLADDIRAAGAAHSAQLAIDRIHGNGNEFVLHLDVDVISDFQATDYPGTGGLRLEDVREALEVFATQKPSRRHRSDRLQSDERPGRQRRKADYRFAGGRSEQAARCDGRKGPARTAGSCERKSQRRKSRLRLWRQVKRGRRTILKKKRPRAQKRKKRRTQSQPAHPASQTNLNPDEFLSTKSQENLPILAIHP